jgi:hypothetical protein
MKRIRALQLPIDMTTIRNIQKNTSFDSKRRELVEKKAAVSLVRDLNEERKEEVRVRKAMVDAEKLQRIVLEKLESERLLAASDQKRNAREKQVRKRARAERQRQMAHQQETNLAQGFAEQACMLARHVSAGLGGWVQERRRDQVVDAVREKRASRKAEREEAEQALEARFNSRRVAVLRQREVAKVDQEMARRHQEVHTPNTHITPIDVFTLILYSAQARLHVYYDRVNKSLTFVLNFSNFPTFQCFLSRM